MAKIKVEMLETPWCNVEERIQQLRKAIINLLFAHP